MSLSANQKPVNNRFLHLNNLKWLNKRNVHKYIISLLVCRGVLLSSILRVFKRFIFFGPGDKTEESATFFTPIISRGSCPFALNLLLILERTDAFPGLSLDPGSGSASTRSLPPHTEEGGEERTEKGKRKGENEAGSERDGTNQKQMLVHVWFSVSKRSGDGAKRLWSSTISPFISSLHFQGFILDIMISYSPGGHKHAAVWLNTPLLSIALPDPIGW